MRRRYLLGGEKSEKENGGLGFRGLDGENRQGQRWGWAAPSGVRRRVFSGHLAFLSHIFFVLGHPLLNSESPSHRGGGFHKLYMNVPGSDVMDVYISKSGWVGNGYVLVWNHSCSCKALASGGRSHVSLREQKNPKEVPTVQDRAQSLQTGSLHTESISQLYCVWLQRAEKLCNTCQHLTIRFQFHIKSWISAFFGETQGLETLGLCSLTAEGAKAGERLLPGIEATSFVPQWHCAPAVIDHWACAVVSFIACPLYVCFGCYFIEVFEFQCFHQQNGDTKITIRGSL